ncbi:M48 family metallopeptidase [Streptomyces sp. NPDC000987]|uniref:M48 family metallopeptidase n=1 Tax=Streptomyces sp. NPDC000987 TaxID=3154374 RepID=UPI003326B985
MAREAGTRGVDVITLDPRVNASVTACGPRRRALCLGMGLWAVLTPQQKVALLGHELGHFAGGDTRHGAVVGSALHTLLLWVVVLTPERWDGRLVHLLVVGLLRIPYHAARGALTVLDKVSLRGQPEREYLADDLAADVASAEAARDLMETLLHAERIEGELRRLSNEATAFAGRDGAPRMDETLWPRLADHLAAVPADERARLLRTGESERHRQDATHPPTRLRLERLERLDRRGPSAAKVVLDGRTATAVEGELRPAARRVARSVARDL